MSPYVRSPAARALSIISLLTLPIGGCGAEPAVATGSSSQVPEDAPVTPGQHSHPVPSASACDSTWMAIRKSIFEAKGCTASACHGGVGSSGELDLGADDAYGSLINRPGRASLTTPMNRVTPGEQSLSLLYLKVAAATLGTPLPSGAGSPMPVAQTPLSDAQLTALKLWIRAGAPEHGVVAGTQELLACAQPASADPNKAPRPIVPGAAEGFQHVAGPWTVEPGSENEVCFATYYDLTESAPEWARIPCTIGGQQQTCVAYDRRELSQDAQSHHSTVTVYSGSVTPSDPAWGAWRCAGGELAGAARDPTKLHVSAAAGGAECGAAGACQAQPRKMVTCTGFGPSGKEGSTISAGGAQAPFSAARYPRGVYSQLPIKGIVLWNAHGFNLTSKQATIEQYNSFWYADPAQRQHLMEEILSAGEATPNVDLWIHVPPYQQREYCSLFTLPRFARLTELSAHVHKRSILWRTWLPPHALSCPPGGCKPDESEPAHKSTSYADPVVRQLDPPLIFDQEDPAARTLKFCSVFDNGQDDPALLKRASQLPAGASCQGPLSCAGGERAGQQCQRDAECGSGRCDACAVTWGVTTEDEMFFLIASYIVVAPR